MTKADAIKQFFSVPEKPITSVELIAFRRHDKEGYDKIGELCIKELEALRE